MESLKNKWRNLSLRNFFILTVLFSIGLAVFFFCSYYWRLRLISALAFT